jgi:hypothetical protein
MKTHTIITADWKDVEGLIDEMEKSIKFLGGFIYPLPSFEGTDMYGFIVSKTKLTKKQIKEIDNLG